MPNLTKTDVDYGSIQLGGAEFRDETLTASVAGILPEGTILERSGTKYVPYVGTVAAPVAILPYEIDVQLAGDLRVRVLVAGRVNKNRLVILGGGTVDEDVCDALRDYGIVPLDVQQLGAYDNPNNP